MKPWIVGAVDAALFLFGWSAIALAAAPDAQAALLFSACWLLPVSVAVWALGTRQARAILAGRGGLRRAAWEGFCWGAGLGLAVVLLSNAPDALAAGGALEGQPLFSGQTGRLASTLGHAGATFVLAGYYDSGDMVLMDKLYAAQLCRRAADGGHVTAKLIHGLGLFYGAHGIRQDKAMGLRRVEEATQDGVEDALE